MRDFHVIDGYFVQVDVNGFDNAGAGISVSRESPGQAVVEFLAVGDDHYGFFNVDLSGRQNFNVRKHIRNVFFGRDQGLFLGAGKSDADNRKIRKPLFLLPFLLLAPTVLCQRFTVFYHVAMLLAFLIRNAAEGAVVYFFKGGFLEGKEGFLWNFLQGWWYRTLVDAKVFEIKRACGTDKEKIKRYLSEVYNCRQV